MRIRRHTTMLAAIGPAHGGPARRDDPGGPAGGTADGGAGGSGGSGGSTGTGDDGGKPADGDDGAGKPKITGDLDPDRAARAIASARDAEKKAKERAQAAEAKQQATLDAVAVALGLKPDPKQDPTELVKQAAAERDQAQAASRAQAVELAVYRTAGKAGGDPDALLDSRGFLTAVADLDPTATDFADKVSAAIKTAVEKNSKLAAAPAGTGAPAGQGPARQGADHTGNGTGSKERTTSLNAAIAAKLGGK